MTTRKVKVLVEFLRENTVEQRKPGDIEAKELNEKLSEKKKDGKDFEPLCLFRSAFKF